MLDPKIFIIKYRAGRLARKLADRSSALPIDDLPKLEAIEALERTFSVQLTESQIAASLLMYYGCFTQLATGEGKTFSIGLAAAWLSSEGKTVHILTPNEYLSTRDKDQLEPFYKALKLNVSLIRSTTPIEHRIGFYQKDIVYTTPSVVAFDRMREISKTSLSDAFQVIPDSSHLIVDEADAVLIENGSVPFIFAQNIKSDVSFWRKSLKCVKSLPEKAIDYDVLSESTFLSGYGYEIAENFLVREGFISRGYELYQAKNSGIFHKLTMAVRAVFDFHENSDYLIEDSKIVVLNQSTGRAERDRQWGQGLHQAIEAKHSLDISEESEVVSKITVPEVLSLYSNFSGTSATIAHAEDEIFKRYGRLTIEVKRAHADNRKFGKDQCFDSKDLKQDVIANDVKSIASKGRPVLIGVETVNEALQMRDICKAKGLNPSVLTAKNEGNEACIIAEAGIAGKVTIATNMAGRGTDIRLGGSNEAQRDEVVRSGGLHVIGASRQSERRLDDQLAGRCGRQGDPGSVQFYISLGDHLLKNQEKITSVRKITEKRLSGLQKSKANKISVARDEIDAFNEVFLIHRDIYYSIRNYLVSQSEDRFFDELLRLFIVSIRSDLLDYGINKSGAYKDIEGFCDKLNSLVKCPPFIDALNQKYSGVELCKRIEKTLLSHLYSRGSSAALAAIREKGLRVIDDMWVNHQILIEQIYDHAKWQALIQKNERIQFAVFGFEAMENFISEIEKALVRVVLEGIE